MASNKTVHIISGGTISKIRPHFAVTAPAYGAVGRDLARIANEQFPAMDVVLHQTRMAGGPRDLETVEDIARLVENLKDDPGTKVIIMAAAMADFSGNVDAPPGRLSTSAGDITMQLTPNPKVIDTIRNTPNRSGFVRKDIFLVSFKATSGATPHEQYLAALNNLKRSSSNLVFANDVKNHRMMVVTPEEARYHETTDREAALQGLIEMTKLRSHLTFTRSTVIAGEPVSWQSDLVPDTLRKVVDHCIARGAYQRFRGSTVGHFAVKLSDTEFLTSRRKTDFNQLPELGLVQIQTDGPDNVVAYGSKPSVGGQSQRIIFNEHPGLDCIVHFHCEIRDGSAVPQVSQRAFECGSHECGQNTSTHLGEFGQIRAVYLREHGPNIVFPRDIDPTEVIDFIEANFDLTKKTGGYQLDAA
jgi:ribulose-5-phosphate 4-epimerase/fuculose-1-phosphate aldolase